MSEQRFVITTARAGVRVLLEKAFTRGPRAGFRYLKRVPYFSGGKLKWRYFYRQEKDLKQGKVAHDPHEEHEHVLISEQPKYHPNLAGKIASTVDTTITVLKQLFGFEKGKAKVEHTEKFFAKRVKPYIEDEETGGAPKRESPMVRAKKAFAMLPESVKSMVDPEVLKNAQGPYKGLKDFQFNELGDTEAIEGALGWAQRQNGKLRIDGRVFDGHVGGAYFGSPLTLGEVVIWHEWGHHVHYALENFPTGTSEHAAWKEWAGGLPGVRITPYAGKNAYEDFAETFACAIAHPKELAEKCGPRYEWMRKHVLTDLPSLEQILDTPDEELTWWDDKPATPASRMLSHLKMRDPAPMFHGFYSPKDQFYQISKDGRTAYARIGPAFKEEEDNWGKIPPPTYQETIEGPDGDPITVELPKYDGAAALGARFKKRDSIKEVYDEHGYPLTDKQAFFYLGIDDAKGIKAAGDTSTTEALDKYHEATKEKGKDTHLLSYEMYTTMGFKKTDSQAKERERLSKIVARFKKIRDKHAKKPSSLSDSEKALLLDEEGKVRDLPDFTLDRHEWAPHEIEEHAFIQKTGTFKFGGIRAAAKQPHTLRTEDGGTQMRYDEATGKQVPVLSMEVYEQENPDGTFTSITVNKSAPFGSGQRILVSDSKGGYRYHKLGKGDPLDAYELARQFDMTADELLKINQRFDRGQITDPILAALINPHGKPIEDATELQQMMRDAAKDRRVDPVTKKVVGRRAWVTVRGSVYSDSGIGHLQVEFDGSGPPKVVGDYWARKLGKAEIRIDEMLTADDEIAVPRIKERKAKRVRIGVGSLVWFDDPKSGKRLLGEYVNKKGKGHQVSVIKGQGTGTSSGLTFAPKVEAASEDIIVGSPSLRRRLVQPLKSHLVLYMDEVLRDSGTESPEGVVKILLPTDGSIKADELMRMPGVRLLGKTKDTDGFDYITITPEDIPAFRENMGGFVMDSRVCAKLKQLDQDTRAISEKAGRTQVIEYVDLEDADGNVNPDGPLAGLVQGDEGIQPGAHRMKALQKLAKNGGRQYAAHFMGTGKTALAIMASEMMRNLDDPETGEPHAGRSTKRTLMVVPLSTAENWYQEHVKFGSPPSLLGSSTLSGAQQVPQLPKRNAKEKDAAYAQRVQTFWKDGLKSNPNWWDPWSDTSKDAVIPMEYFRDHEEALRVLGQFDGLVVDEAHKVARENELSRAIERWNPDMKLFLLLSGTPITNTLDTLPRIVDLVSGGKVKLGTVEEFRDRHLIPSNVMRSFGRKKAPLIDINPQKVGELAAILQPLMDVATTADVKGKSMPAVLLDENEPSHMTGQQARMYRLAMASLTEAERTAIGMSATLGVEEESLLDEGSRRKIGLARSVSNSPAYKAPDQRENATYTGVITEPGRGGSKVTVREVELTFELPSIQQMTGSRKKGFWGGKWPGEGDVEKGIVSEGYLLALQKYMDRVIGVSYDNLAGKKIDAGLLKKVRADKMTTLTGETWGKDGGRLKNPDYGPEAMICRGELDEVSGAINPLLSRYFDSATGEYEEIEVPVGKRFIRDYRAKATGLYFDEEDWEGSGRFSDVGEDDTGDDDDEGVEGPVRTGKGMQGPKEGREAFNIQRHPTRRRSRAQFDLATTKGNAKCDKMEQILRGIFAEETGAGAKGQAIIFGKQVGSSVRTTESKLRTMGYMDINEALGHEDVSSPEDKKRALGNRKFFITYMGKSATLGDRDINSEIFRRVQDQFGKDTGMSVLVSRTMYGTAKDKRLKPGEMVEPWGRSHRKKIAKQFVGGSGKAKRDGTPAGLEIPMRVVGHKDPKTGEVSERYIYESDVPSKARRSVQQLEILQRSQRGAAKEATHAKIKSLLMEYQTDRKPLTDAQIDIFNSCQVMVASDAANVGLNWPCNDLIMYDSLFSPMEEWQRITRAARMLPPAVRGAAKPYVEKIGAYIEKIEATSGFKEYEGVDSALKIVQEAIDNALTPAERNELNDLPGGAPDQIIEAWFAKRAFDKIASLRETVGARLRKEGAVPDPNKPPGKDNFISKEAITEADVMNEILRTKLTAFDREILKSRRYMVHVHRLLTSVDVPVMKKIKIPGLGTTTVATGEYETQSPSLAERSQLAQQRAKMVPYEFFLKIVQNAQPTHTKYDFIPAWRGSLGSFSRMPEDDAPEVVHGDGGDPPDTKKSLFYVPLQVRA